MPQRPGTGDDRRQQRRRADALVVIADEHDVGLAQLPARCADESARPSWSSSGSRDLVIDADHLLRMAMLGPADVALLDRARPAGVGDDALRGRCPGRSASAGCGRRRRRRRRRRPASPGAQGAQHGGDAAGPAQPFLAAVGVQQDDRRLLADALRRRPRRSGPASGRRPPARAAGPGAAPGRSGRRTW